MLIVFRTNDYIKRQFHLLNKLFLRNLFFIFKNLNKNIAIFDVYQSVLATKIMLVYYLRYEAKTCVMLTSY